MVVNGFKNELLLHVKDGDVWFLLGNNVICK